ncbi:MAG: peptidoglycan DD-metalloendopeptidase family protein [Rhizobiaceae bacterium]|jgi:septal ring factor EnvC (AmiA/AmiB activator)|nr:peptidoglycan DD-metalloendopeptidase family protein [Rhizobiaceae bacterium]
MPVRSALAAALLSVALIITAGGAWAETSVAAAPAQRQGAVPTEGESDPAAADLAARRAQTLAEIEVLTRAASLSAEKREALAAEVAGLKKDEASIAAALLAAAETERRIAADIASREAELVALGDRSETVRASLRGRSAVLAEVLAALQRLGRNPPPAILVTPQDALASVRSAVLLGAVVPAMRGETEALKADLAALVKLGEDTARARGNLESGLAAQLAEQNRLDLLLDEKKALAALSQSAIADEDRRAAETLRSVESLKALLDRIDRDIADVQKLADQRRAAIEKARLPAGALPSLGPSAAFSALKGALPMPVSGRRVLGFGGVNGAGVATAGDTFRTRSRAIVTSPADAVVEYAAAFRSYDHLVILDAGNGYRMVIAGLAKLGVRPGQTVLAGEPLGVMGERAASGVAVSSSLEQPELYVELRKDGQAVDPAAWWQALTSGLQGDDT